MVLGSLAEAIMGEDTTKNARRGTFDFLHYAKTTVSTTALSAFAAGVVSRTATAPVDRVRIICSTTGMTVPEGVRASIKQGFRGIYKGNIINCLKVGPELGIKFGVAAAVSPFKTSESLRKEDPNPWRSHPAVKFLSGCAGGMFSQLAIYPLEVTRTTVATTGPEVTIVGTMHQIYSKHGILGFYRGLLVSLSGIMPYAGLEIMLAASSHAAVARSNIPWVQDHQPMVRAAAGCLSTAIAGTVTYPIYVLRTRLQAHAARSGTAPSAVATVRAIWLQHGIGGFFRGVIPNLVKIIPATAIQWIVFEQAKAALQDL